MSAKERIKKELGELVKQANDLLGKFKDKKQNPLLHLEYQDWYSKALKAMEWLAPDRPRWAIRVDRVGERPRGPGR